MMPQFVPQSQYPPMAAANPPKTTFERPVPRSAAPDAEPTSAKRRAPRSYATPGSMPPATPWLLPEDDPLMAKYSQTLLRGKDAVRRLMTIFRANAIEYVEHAADRYTDVVNTYGLDDTVITPSGRAVRRSEFDPLISRDWLTDEVINTYSLFVTECAGRTGRKVHVMTSFFYTRLDPPRGFDYDAVRRWTGRAGIVPYELDTFAFPVNHHNTHWTGAAVLFDLKAVIYYDSFSGRQDSVIRNTIRFMLAEAHRLGHPDPTSLFSGDEWVAINGGRVYPLTDAVRLYELDRLAAVDAAEPEPAPAPAAQSIDIDSSDCIDLDSDPGVESEPYQEPVSAPAPVPAVSGYGSLYPRMPMLGPSYAAYGSYDDDDEVDEENEQLVAVDGDEDGFGEDDENAQEIDSDDEDEDESDASSEPHFRPMGGKVHPAFLRPGLALSIAPDTSDDENVHTPEITDIDSDLESESGGEADEFTETLLGLWSTLPRSDKLAVLAEYPAQHNGVDCGVFASLFIRCVVLGHPLWFRQADIPNARKMMMLEMHGGGLADLMES
ncbi:Peptidase C48 SUMO/Sentrin/Ubl1 [Carpediemonas membranifera]|uniref:Peptidase C48 SUMO/Sentrin/Ubl1 n=1 Tax=Carpediemonas membranifera TaxID=201153 RepID=A0A8J6E6X7_9EUKA|nr:Peptidase C48 SUMO/Sentrin/Ubl1 [Carpediemonas membranifera]|eukprot:KAG9390040.1 Peptidase C48 SUMO/Sentrin/Ubl1 [Carpediemonas membranifera]